MGRGQRRGWCQGREATGRCSLRLREGVHGSAHKVANDRNTVRARAGKARRRAAQDTPRGRQHRAPRYAEVVYATQSVLGGPDATGEAGHRAKGNRGVGVVRRAEGSRDDGGH